MTRVLPCAFAAVLLAACLTDFPPLPPDGTTRDGPAADGVTEADGDGPAVDLDQGLTPDRGTLVDTAPTDTTPGPDTSTVCLTNWNDWTCSTNPSNCVATCGSYKLVCNKTQCTCTDGNTINTCGTSSSTECSACQGEFGAGCCQGL